VSFAALFRLASLVPHRVRISDTRNRAVHCDEELLRALTRTLFNLLHFFFSFFFCQKKRKRKVFSLFAAAWLINEKRKKKEERRKKEKKKKREKSARAD
jgi:hypothetical protein